MSSLHLITHPEQKWRSYRRGHQRETYTGDTQNLVVLQVWLIDVSQSVEPTHPHALEFLFRDCRNVSTVTAALVSGGVAVGALCA